MNFFANLNPFLHQIWQHFLQPDDSKPKKKHPIVVLLHWKVPNCPRCTERLLRMSKARNPFANCVNLTREWKSYERGLLLKYMFESWSGWLTNFRGLSSRERGKLFCLMKYKKKMIALSGKKKNRILSST